MRIPPLVALFGAIGGAVATILGSVAVSLGIAMLLHGDELMESLSDPERMTALLMDYPVVAASVVATASFLIGVPILVARFSKTSVKEALGFRSAPWLAFVLAPIGIIALGPTSDALVGLMKEIAPDASFGALDSIGKLVEGNPAWMLWPIIALCPGFSEEIFFRGLIQRSAGFGTRAIVISAITFSFFHMDPHHIAGVLPLGFYLAWLGARTGSTFVPILAHTVNNSVALIAGKIEIAQIGEGTETPIPLWVLPIGWAIAAGCVYGIWRVTKDRERWLGPAAAADAAKLPTAPTVSPDWRIVRTMGARAEILGYVREARLALPDVIGLFQPGADFEEHRTALEALETEDESSRAQAHASLEGFALEDMHTGQRLEDVSFEISLIRAEVRFRATP